MEDADSAGSHTSWRSEGGDVPGERRWTQSVGCEQLGARRPSDHPSLGSLARGLAGVLAGVTILIVLNGPKGLLLLTFALPAIVIISAWSYRSIGGLVGDSLGAIAQLAQMSLLIGSVALTDGSCDCSW